MSTLKTNSVQIGQSTTAANNFVLSVPATPDGTLKISRGNVGATTQDVLSIGADGRVEFPSGAALNTDTSTLAQLHATALSF